MVTGPGLAAAGGFGSGRVEVKATEAARLSEAGDLLTVAQRPPPSPGLLAKESDPKRDPALLRRRIQS